MANRETVTLRFIKPPTAAQAALITRRIHEEDVPVGAAGAAIAFRDHDFPGFGTEDGHPCMEQASWRAPNLRIDRFQALLHVLGFPNDACSYPSWAIEEEDFIALLYPSSPAVFSQEEVQMVRLLFPEFERNLKGSEAPSPDEPAMPRAPAAFDPFDL